MPKITLNLSDEAARVLDEKVESGEVPSADAYVDALVRSMSIRSGTSEEIREMVADSLATGIVGDADRAFFTALKEDIASRFGRRKSA